MTIFSRRFFLSLYYNFFVLSRGFSKKIVIVAIIKFYCSIFPLKKTISFNFFPRRNAIIGLTISME
ncbi:MAG: hypothetical protein DBX59_06550 [Bacillota bacterium]|nr:MAG: hypothetical protein DBX59_06550 [Bacillota bacterium]